ncbi:hypothetical protein LOTGIDRAFT_156167 [Lottia gigantea]|uniref:Myosin motor domain-containing protein n=1 Tax=Lottia gigantea TaxID=225164 RepID=V4BGF9_LOTGI|nr:hypothetical protein LOTGIDRAFT_156167 [Lottia gigantea]ESP04927.1 hypothetical protein LOTGIDRAFT_156167 [Lottia gigantea]
MGLPLPTPNLHLHLLVAGAINNPIIRYVLKLVKKGIDPNFTTGNGVSLLHKCCTEGNAIVAEILISQGADVNIKDDDWWTPLHTACHLDNTDLVQLLLNNGAEASILDVDGNFPIDHAPAKSESYNLLATHLEEKGLDSNELSELRIAASRYVCLEIQTFIDHGVDVSKPLFDGITWLHIVCANGYKKGLKLLLENQADVNAVDLNGWTPLHVAAKFNQLMVVKILLKCNARTDIAGIHGFRPVDVAATEEIQRLIDDHRKRRQCSETSETDFEEIEEEDAFLSKTVRPPELPLPKAEKFMEAQIRAQYLDDVPTRKTKMSEHESEKDFDHVSTILKVHPSEKVDWNFLFLNSHVHICFHSISAQGTLPSTGPSDDLTHLATLTERHILEILQERYKYNKIYTNIGEILIAVNPLQTLPYYSKQICHLYQNANILCRLPPHIYSNAEHALREMRASGRSQCCVIGGESGSGKTETCKFIVQHLIEVSKCQDINLLHKIHQINPLLEAFGNAQTLMNNNSSRYAKYLELKYCPQGKKLLGASLKEYLLEKSRVVNHGNQELNYHIFYWMLAGLTVEECRVNMIDKKKPYRYLGEDFSPQMTIENKQKFWEDISSLVTILAAILHLGNITFIPVDDGRAKIDNEEALKKVSSLLCIPSEDLQSALVEDVLITRGEQTLVYLTAPQASTGTDALAKSLYSRLFSWIVNGINQFVQPDEESSFSEFSLSISIIDLFGFENLQQNSFEQMCINVANEKLQLYFNQQVFQQELEDCKAEGIKTTASLYSSNDTVISLFLDKTCSIMSVLDEECSFPKASDRSLAAKIHQGPGDKYKKVYKSPRDGGPSFNVCHYAGTINYSLEGVLEKNRDKLRPYVTTTMKSSTKLIFRELFQTTLSAVGSLQTSVRQFSMKRKPEKSTKGLTKIVHRVKGTKPAKRLTRKPPATMAFHFRNSLNDLMIKLSSTKPHFIRCISPNTLKTPAVFIPSYVQIQLKYTGILETVKIRKNGFAVRVKFADFLGRYKYLHALRMLGNKKPLVESMMCKQILERWKVEGYQIGKTKVFLHPGHLEKLDSINSHFDKMVVKAQAVMRGCYVRKKMQLRYSKRERDASHIEILSFHVNRLQKRVYQYQTDLIKYDLESAKLQSKDEEQDALQALDDVFVDEVEYGRIWELSSSIDNADEIDENFKRYSTYLTAVHDPAELPFTRNSANNLEPITESGTNSENQALQEPNMYESIKDLDENQNPIPPPTKHKFVTSYYVNLPNHGKWSKNRQSDASSIKPEDSISIQGTILASSTISN